MSDEMTQPAENAAAVTLSDTVALTNGPCRALYVGVAGDVKVTMRGGGVVTFKAMAVGYHPVQARIVWSTGTTATDIVALY